MADLQINLNKVYPKESDNKPQSFIGLVAKSGIVYENEYYFHRLRSRIQTEIYNRNNKTSL